MPSSSSALVLHPPLGQLVPAAKSELVTKRWQPQARVIPSKLDTNVPCTFGPLPAIFVAEVQPTFFLLSGSFGSHIAAALNAADASASQPRRQQQMRAARPAWYTSQ